MAAVVGAIVARPTLATQRAVLALATLAFAIMADSFLFPLRWIGGGQTGVTCLPPQVGPINFSAEAVEFFLCLVVLSKVDYEAQAAIELEGAAIDEPDNTEGYSIDFIPGNWPTEPARLSARVTLEPNDDGSRLWH